MSLSDDDDELGESLSNPRSLERSDHRKQERQEKKEKADLLKLKSQVQLQRLKNEKQDKAKADASFGTKTREQEIAKKKETIAKKDTPDTLLEESQEQEAAMDQAQIEEQRSGND